jgi:hypothetical protein
MVHIILLFNLLISVKVHGFDLSGPTSLGSIVDL